MKALSLWEPWASLMRCGAKTIETRSWYTSYRGPLLICGAKRWSDEQDAILRMPEIQRGLLKRLAAYTPLRRKRDMLFGQ
ncbi:MAG: ASCH domain-containing protein, partial [Planctomycetes bacterium]|nr:ASCH domain-containing protein [Planctomycetota bacterium]